MSADGNGPGQGAATKELGKANSSSSFAGWVAEHLAERDDIYGALAQCFVLGDPDWPDTSSLTEMHEHLERRGVNRPPDPDSIKEMEALAKKKGTTFDASIYGDNLHLILDFVHAMFTDDTTVQIETEDRFTDARLAERVAAEVMADRYIWVPGIK
jgi:hypothetical protein